MFNKSTEQSNWLSIADMMTALMIIFMFISINFIIQVIEHTFIEEDIYNKLQEVFAEDLENQSIRLGPDGAIRFSIDSQEELFRDGEPTPTPYFKVLLDEFLPKYWALIESDSSYFDYIREIRIEGHADPRRYFKPTDIVRTDEVSYLNNLELSQFRAKNVLKYLREQPLYLNADENEKARMDFLFTAIGFSHSRTLNDEGNYVYLDSNKTTNNQMSRRVEFRIVTSNEKLARKLLQIDGN